MYDNEFIRIIVLPGTDYSALRASRLALRVALKGDRRRYAASSNRLVYVGGSN
jgi:hypothetical protein